MKRSMKRMLSLLLTLAMVVTMLPANVQAKEQREVPPREEADECAATVEETRSIPEPEEIPADSGDVQVYINPRFAGQMEETELRARLEQAQLQATPASQTEAVTVEEAIVLLRESMVKREEGFSVTVFSESPTSDSQYIVNSALEHTGNPKEGDYLRMQLMGWSIGTNVLHYGDGGCYYSLSCGMVFDTNAAQEAEVDAAVEQILVDLDVSGKSDYEKIKAVYDWVCANVVYDYEHLGDDSYWIKQTAYGALIYGTCVCEGYALLVYRLALELGVDCRMIVGTSLLEPHAWNIAKLAGWYYYLDATWDAGTHPNDYIWFLGSGPVFSAHTPEFQDWAFAIDYTGNAFREAYPYAPSGSDPTDSDGPFDDDTAVSGFCGDQATWSFDSTTGRLTVSGTGEMYSYLPTTRRPWEHLSDRIREVVVEGTVERVGAYAFAGLDSLTSMVVEPGVTSVGGHAVMGCNRLASVTIPASVTEMGEETFRDCSLLSSAGPIGSDAAVEFGWTAEIPRNAFYNMSQLTAITLPDMLTTIGRYAFTQTGLSEIIIPDSVTLIGKGAFEKSSLTRVHVGSGVEVIGAYAFRYCRNLTGITLEQGVQEIGDQALEGCVSLAAVTIPDSVTRLGECAFAFCTALTAVEFLGSPPVFDRVAAGEYSNVFYFVTANVFCYYDQSWTKDTMRNYGGTLTWVFRERNSVTQDDLTWEYDPVNRQLTVRGSGLMADYVLSREFAPTAPWAAHSQDVCVIVLEEGITHIGNYAFYGFSQLRQIVIPESVETIGQCALEGCERMPAVLLPSALRSVGRFAFRGAAELFVVNFGPALEAIREKAFENCARLANVTFSGDEPTLEDEVFGRSKAGIRYPAANDTWDTLPGYGGGVGNYWCAYGSAEGELGRGTFGNGLTWVVDGDGVLTITGSGPMPDYTNADYYEIPWRAYNEKIAKIVVGEGVETIGSRVFEETIYTTEVTLPETLVSINEYAFQGMYCLNTLIIPDSVTHIGNNAVSSASSLQYLTLGSQLQSIDSEAFAFSSSLYRIELPASLQSIEAGAFGSCGNLVRIEVDPNSNSFCSDEQGVLYSKDRTTLFQMGGGYQGAYRVDAATTVIAGNACKEVKGLTEVRTQGEVCQVGNFAFYGCENLQLADLGGSLESIGEYAFGRCFKLSGFDFGDKLTAIGDYGFYQCESLNQIVLPDTMQTVGLSAFEYCGLPRIDLGNGIRSMGDNAFRGNEITELVIPASLEEVGACVFQLNTALESVTFEPGLTYVAERMFDQCSSLETVTLTDTITELRTGAFADCVDLDGIELPDSVKRIESAFSGCTALRNVRMSAGLESLGEYAFSDCTVLEKIVLPKTLVTMHAGCFGGCTALKEVIIPASVKVQSVSTVLYGTFSNCTGLETVIFMGDAPAIYLQYPIFSGVEATAYYPGDNTTWTEEIRTNFGGTIDWVPVTIYPMLSDSDTTATVGSADAFTVRSEGDLADLLDVRVDGEVVDPANYTAAEGSTIITFADSYLQSLDSGLHTVSLTFTDGLAADVFDLVGGNSHMHSYTAVVTEPTCQAQGYTTYTCECGDSYVGNYVYADHVYTSEVTEPTCEEKGYTTYTCSVCGYSYQDNFVPEIGHYYTGNSVDPTCEEEGYTIWRCANCDHSYTEYYGEPLGHDYVDGVCTRCYQDDPNYDPEEPGEEEVQYPIVGTCGENVTWRLDEDGTLTISGTGDMEDYDHMYLQPWVDYADQIKRGVVDGTVNRIGERAFFNLKQLTSVTIEEGVTEIAEYAFWSSTNLTSVTIPESVTTVGYYAFRDCDKLTGAGPIGGGYNIEFAWTEEIPENAFYYSNCLETAVMPDSMRVIRDYAFAFTGLREIELNDGLETIGYSAFMNCYYLKSLKMPASVNRIESGAFSDCTGLTDVYFLGSAPEEFSSNAFDGVTATMWYPAGDASWENHWFQDYENGLTWQSYNAANPPWEETDPTEPTEPGDPTEPSEPEDPEVSELNGMFRLAGPSRYDTGFAIANKLKEILGIEKFSAVIVAYGQNFPDALTGSYLAAVKGAPILLTEPSADANLLNYLQNNLVSGGKVYILGGTAAVSQSFEDQARSRGFNVQRLKGAGRYETNLEILKEAGVNTTDEVLIATGKNYADSLSASATGLPMLLVDQKLTDSQKAFLQGTSKKFVILGGTGAVSADVEAELDAIGDVTRVKGASRYGTSVEIAKRYFENPKAAVLAYAQGFPDGLCGGPLAFAVGAPLILTSNESSTLADEYVAGITSGAVTGGTARISDDTVREIFDLPANTPIVKP